MESSNTAQAEDTQSGPTQEYVEIPDATDDDLEQFIETSQELELNPPQQEEPQAPVEPKQEQQQKQVELAPEQQQLLQQLASKQEMDAVRKQLDGLELLNKRRTSELAELKNQLRSFISSKSQGLDEKFLESPTQAYAQMREVEMAQQKLVQAEAEEQAITNAHQAQVLLAHHIGKDGLDLEAITETLQADGMPPEFIQAFMSNPYQAALPETLIQLAHRANDRKRLRSLEQAIGQLVPYTERLLAERKQIPNDVLKNVSSALRQGAQVTGSAGGTGQVGSGRPVDFAKMSDRELEEFLKG